MAENSSIEWTDHTFNPWIGCTKVSPGCANCYAAVSTRARVLRAAGQETWGKGAPRSRTKTWDQPRKWNRKPWICDVCGRASDRRHDHSCTGDPKDACHTSNVTWHRPRVFCASLADWLDDEVPLDWLWDLIGLIKETPNLDWLLLTKRPENFHTRFKEVCNRGSDLHDDFVFEWLHGTPPANVWIGTTVEDQKRADQRIPELLNIPAKVRFLSCEPLLGPVNIFGDGGTIDKADAAGLLDDIPFDRENPFRLHWVIAGGESGPNARPMHPDWARSLRDQACNAGVPFLFKQWGEWEPRELWSPGPVVQTAIDLVGRTVPHDVAPQDVGGQRLVRVGKKAAGRLLDGQEWNEFPKP